MPGFNGNGSFLTALDKGLVSATLTILDSGLLQEHPKEVHRSSSAHHSNGEGKRAWKKQKSILS